MPSKRSVPLEEYRRKRDFQRTPEPQPKKKASPTGRLFVVQKHRAQQLHYDFRLELDGVLLSWAVPKGPSLDPSEKRLAVQTEDHPIEYGGFEGVIPEEEYGGGTVMLWDRGEWSPLDEPRSAIEKGTLKFQLNGQKLCGAWTLVRLKEKGSPTRNWLLIKERDGEARDEDSFSIIDEEPFSAVSGRTIGEIAAARDRTWTGGGAAEVVYQVPIGRRRGLRRRVDMGAEAAPGAKKAKLPDRLGPIQAKSIKVVPKGEEWVHEILQVGWRILCWITEQSVTLRSEAGEDWTPRLAALARALARLPVTSAILDGIVSDSIDVPSDGGLQNGKLADPRYHIFDLPFCDGYDLRGTPLFKRKELLCTLLQGADDALEYCDHVEGHGDIVVAEAKRLGAQGIVSKRAVSTYATRQASDWRVLRLRDVDAGLQMARRRRPSRVADADVAVAGVKLTHPSRILYPEERVTKQMLAEYYEAVAPRMLPFVRARPLSLYRCPGGIEKECFFQKQLGEMSSKHLRGARTGDDPYIVLHDTQALVTLAQWNVLEIHTWGCRESDLDHPDMMVFDLDPGPNVPWELIVEGAKGLRLLLDELGLRSFVKTSGGKGLHVTVPLARRQDWDEVKDFAARVARRIVAVAPKHFTVMMSKPERRGKVFIDYFRNHRGSTCAAPYSTRARTGAFASMPLGWDELHGSQPRLHLFQVLDRLREPEPWKDFFAIRQSLSRKAIHWLRK